MFHKMAVAILFLSFCCVSPAFSAQLPIISKIQDFYGKTESFAADFAQRLEHKESGSTEQRNGNIKFKKPLKIYWQTKKPHEEILVINQREIWDYLPDEEIAYRYSPKIAQDSGGIIQVLTGQAALNKEFDVKPVGSEGNLQKLQLYPHEPTPQLVEALIWVDDKTGRIVRARITDFYGNANDVALSNFNDRVKLADKDFDYKPPKGIEIEDRLDKPIQERELFK